MRFRLTISLILTLVCFLSLSLYAQNNHHAHEKEALKAGEIHSGHSLYHLDSEFITHRNERVKLENFIGKPVIIVMFYGDCTEVCPILIKDTWRLFSLIEEKQRKEVRVLAISFDTDNDTPAVLRDYAEYEQLDLPNWHFITGNQTDIRSLAMMLGVKYQKTSDGSFAHSNLITVLDTEGKVLERIEGLNQPMDSAAKSIERLSENRHIE